MEISIDGVILDEENAKISVLDHGLLLGDGLFETMRTYRGKTFKLHEHYTRLAESAGKIFLQLPFTEKEIGKMIESLIAANKLSEARVRVTVTRGIGAPGLSIDCSNPKTIIIATKLEEHDYSNGVRLITTNAERAMPGIKSLSYLPSVIAKKNAQDLGAFEAVYVDSQVREGSFSNVFMVKEGIIKTPKEKILRGITRDYVIELAEKNKVKVIECDITVEELYGADEVFITYSTAGIVPVIMVDKKIFKVGDTTKKLIELYAGGVSEWMQKA
ncbi:MAG: aminotransferase class IV [Candidatus Altiarchaeota archaeon]|nr:aminotransferase class IV [Candidatus Altiarchaeota archaeon]